MTALLETLVCRLIGCTSLFARWWEWPYLRVCSPFVLWLYHRQGRRSGLRGKP